MFVCLCSCRDPVECLCLLLRVAFLLQLQTSRRAFLVLNPLKVTLTNVAEDAITWHEAPDFPQDTSRGSHRLPLTRTVYIDKSDFKMEDSKDYYGLAPGKVVSLKYAGHITCTHVISSPSGEVLELEATYDPTRAGKVKGHLHWVSGSAPGEAPHAAEVRLFKPLFNEEMEVIEGSLEVVTNAFVDNSVVGSPAFTRLQFERVRHVLAVYVCAGFGMEPWLRQVLGRLCGLLPGRLLRRGSRHLRRPTGAGPDGGPQGELVQEGRITQPLVPSRSIVSVCVHARVCVVVYSGGQFCIFHAIQCLVLGHGTAQTR